MDITKIAESYYDEAIALLKELAVIPAPSGYEDKRAEFILDYLKKLGIDNAYIDSAKNVIYTIGEPSDDMVVFMAHTDIVFPFETPLAVKEDEKNFCCPGISDDTARVVMMLIVTKYIVENNIKLDHTLLFSANACEEGLGNLKGCKQIFKDFAGKIKRMYTFDGSNNGVVNEAVGSHRYQVTAYTEGGHSFNAFGNRNAINVLAGIISEVYKIQVPQIGNSKTTYNVGTISGGRTVNTIAQEATMLIEYRSDNVDCLNIMKDKFNTIFEEAKKNCLELKVELLGDRPCTSNDIDKKELDRLTKMVVDIQGKHGKCDVSVDSGSTDANIPLSLGIPAICVGAGVAGKAHTLEEWFEKESMKSGLAICMELILTEGRVL